MRQRSWVWLAAACVVALVAAACGSSSSSSSGSGGGGGSTAPPGGAMPTSIGKGEGALNLVVWAGYAEDGSNDPNYDWVHPFEQETGCKVTSKVAATSDEMVQLLHTGQYDGVSASGNASTRLILAGDAAPVNVDLIKNYADLSAFLKDQPYNTYQGTHYGIPHGWGANLLMWRPDKVKPDPDSWSVVFDPNSPYKGHVTAYDDPIYIADAALYLKATQPNLGITDPYELTQDQFNAAVNLLKQQRTIIGQYWNDYTKDITAYVNGDTVIGTAWQIIANLINLDPKNPPVKVVVPKEGSTGWSDTWMVYSKAAHPNCMYMWMDFITRPEIQAQVAQWFGEAPSNPKACDLIAKGVGKIAGDPTFCDTFHATDESFYKSVAFWKVPVPQCSDNGPANCVAYPAWLNAWVQIKG
jgi:putative spermidine/putrescine transport system substrate-binding protein